MERPREKCHSMRALCKSMDIILGSSAAIRHRMGHRVMQPPTVGFASIPGLLKLAEKNKETINLMTVEFCWCGSCCYIRSVIPGLNRNPQ